VATVDDERAARHVGGGVGGKQEERAVELLGAAETTLRDAIDQRQPGVRREEITIDVGLDVAGAIALTRML